MGRKRRAKVNSEDSGLMRSSMWRKYQIAVWLRNGGLPRQTPYRLFTVELAGMNNAPMADRCTKYEM